MQAANFPRDAARPLRMLARHGLRGIRGAAVHAPAAHALTLVPRLAPSRVHHFRVLQLTVGPHERGALPWQDPQRARERHHELRLATAPDLHVVEVRQ